MKTGARFLAVGGWQTSSSLSESLFCPRCGYSTHEGPYDPDVWFSMRLQVMGKHILLNGCEIMHVVCKCVMASEIYRHHYIFGCGL